MKKLVKENLNLDELGADIRNKLSPFKNLMALVRALREARTEEEQVKIQKYINSSLLACDESLKYLSELL